MSPTSSSPRKRPKKLAEEEIEIPLKATTTVPSSEKAITPSPDKRTKKTAQAESEEDLITINKKDLILNLKSNKRLMDLLEKVAFEFLAEKISAEGERVLQLERADTSKSFEEHQTSESASESVFESKSSTPQKPQTRQSSQAEESILTYEEIGRMMVKDAQSKSSMQNDVIMALISNNKNVKKYIPKKKESPKSK